MRCRTFGTFATDLVAIAIFQDALEGALNFSDTNGTQEVGGFLVGLTYVTDRQMVEVRRFVPARSTRSNAASLTFTHDTWSDLHRFMMESCPDERILGWYHTHPGLGVFLSSNDVFIQRHFFAEPWHIGLVVDPREGELAFFQWRDRQIVDCGFAIVES